MYIKKILETCIDLLNPEDIYQSDYDGLLLKQLTERYQNKCYQSIYILKINHIIRRSSIRMSSVRLDGGASVDVQFEVSGIILIENEILHNCKIEQIHDYAITASHEYVGIKLRKNTEDIDHADIHNQMMQTLKIGQHIPVIVKQIRYLTNKNQISIVGVPYTPFVLMNEPYYYISNGLSKEQHQKLEFLINMIKEEEKIHDKLKTQKQYKFFKDLMYPYKEDKHYEMKTKYKPVGFIIDEIKNIKSGYTVYPAEDDKSNGRLFLGDSIVSNETEFKVADLFTVVSSYCNEYLQYLLALRGFITTYESVESMKPLLTYFKLCKMVKLD